MINFHLVIIGILPGIYQSLKDRLTYQNISTCIPLAALQVESYTYHRLLPLSVDNVGCLLPKILMGMSGI